jgi:small subunit ribosomal protein S8
MTTDPIADMLSRIRNASQALLPSVEMDHSKIKESIAQILKHQGYVEDCEVSNEKHKQIKIRLKFEGRQGVIRGLKRVSRPGLRRYVAAAEVPRVLGGLGISIVSTSQGLMTGHEARRQNLGGELLCFIW